jgi:Fe-S oxidoreductase
MSRFKEIVKDTRAYLCLECGVCFASCPLSRVYPDFSPRLIVKKALFSYDDEIISDRGLWSCFNCGTCTSRCPSNVDYQRFIRETRKEARRLGYRGVYAHNEILQTITRLQQFDLPQNRTFWITKDLKVADKSEYLYFVGCLPYFDSVFRDFSFTPTDIGKNAVKILNVLGITPMVSSREKCCGHDLLINGDEEGFRRLAQQNIDMIRKSGAGKVVFSCPEGYYSFRNEYTEFFGNLPFEVVHLTELLASALDDGTVTFREKEDGEDTTKVTYQDPCNLGRMSGLYEEPRRIIERIPGVELVEMQKNRADAVCCGTSGWVECSTCSKIIQMDRFKSALEVGAERLITACPKCQIHFRCALEKSDVKLEIQDLESLVASALEDAKSTV